MISSTIEDNKTVRTKPINSTHPLYDELTKFMLKHGRFTVIISYSTDKLKDDLERLGLEIEE